MLGDKLRGLRTQQIRIKLGWESDFCGLEVACWLLVTKFAGSQPAEAVEIFRAKKYPQHVFLLRGSKAVGPMS
jgi:hypothetical protein